MDDGEEIYYDIFTKEEKMVSEYTGLNLIEVNELDCFEYWLYLRDAFIYSKSSYKEGREYLEKAWLLKQDKQDRNTLRKLFSRGKD